MPKRVQWQRIRGSGMPPDTVYVGRPGKWGNPFHISGHLSRDSAVFLFGLIFDQGDLSDMSSQEKISWPRGKAYPKGDIDKLRGKNLACWCRLDQACHADILLEVANRPVEGSG